MQLRQTNMHDMELNRNIVVDGAFLTFLFLHCTLRVSNCFGDGVPFYVNELNCINLKRLLIQRNFTYVLRLVQSTPSTCIKYSNINCQRDSHTHWLSNNFTVSRMFDKMVHTCMTKRILTYILQANRTG